MKIENLHFNNLRNEEHLEFGNDLCSLVVQHSPQSLNIQEPYNSYVPLHNNEGEAVDFIRKSSLSEQIFDADMLRDEIFRGLYFTVKAAVIHYNLDIRPAGKRLEIVLDQFGDLASKPYEQESGAIESLLVDLNGAYAADVALIGAGGWLAELAARNNAFRQLVAGRFTETTGKTTLRMKEVRTEVDNAYEKITGRINALMLINGEAPYTAFVTELNLRIEHYRNLIAIRKGKKDKDKVAQEGKAV